MERQLHITALTCGLIGAGLSFQSQAEEDFFNLDDDDILSLSIEDIMNLEITSVSKKAQKLSDSAAAVFMITQDDIRRSGATSIPEVLRMAPGVNVARINANEWAVTSRGLNGRFANKLLVLLDGRSVYIPSFSGVYWEQFDTLMADIERIEIIRGPGATLWGANAVNGIINIITQHGADTQGGLITAGGGDEETGFGSIRYGTTLGDNTYGRIYLKTASHDDFKLLAGGDADDDWDITQGGFRIDSQINTQDLIQIQGDAYQANINQKLFLPALTPPLFIDTVDDRTDASGVNVLAKWQHTLSVDAEYSLVFSFDTFRRDEVIIKEVRNTVNLDYQYRFSPLHHHDLIWGVGYRYTADDFRNSFNIIFDPDESTDKLYSAFIQDEITLDESLKLTLGSKFEYNDFSGFEYQPSGRIIWMPVDNHRIWGSISRAVRTPSRTDQDSTLVSQVMPPLVPPNSTPLPLFVTALGNPSYDSEELLAWELGYRWIPAENKSFDLALFYNDYDQVRGFTQSGVVPFVAPNTLAFPIVFNNELSGQTYGLELSSVWQVYDSWRLDLTYSYLEVNIKTANNFDDTIVSQGPRNQVSLRSTMNLLHNVDLDFWFRYVDETAIRGNLIEDYVTLDIHFAWRPTDTLEFSVVGQNLLDSRHQEFVQELFINPTEIERSVYAKITIQF